MVVAATKVKVTPLGVASTIGLVVCAAVGMNTIGWYIIRKLKV